MEEKRETSLLEKRERKRDESKSKLSPGYPTGHPEATSYEDDLLHLR